MIINYFGNSSMLSIQQKKFSDKCKKGFPQNFRRSWKVLEVNHKVLLDDNGHVFLWLHLHQACFVSNFMEKVVGLTNLNILRTTRAIFMNLFIVKQTFACEKVIPKKWTAFWDEIPFPPAALSLPLSLILICFKTLGILGGGYSIFFQRDKYGKCRRKKCARSKKKESNLFLFQAINLAD